MPPTIRRAEPSDANALLEIYGPIVRDSSASFETEVPTTDAFAKRITQCNKRHVWLVQRDGERVLGYAYANAHRAREAYRFSVETSVYVGAAARGQGIGRSLYERLLSEVTLLGYFHAYAGITMPNDTSVRLHQALGFQPIGVFPNVGYKYGRWHDVSWWSRVLKSGVPNSADHAA